MVSSAKIDIVIPVWNQADLTIQCLRSIGEYTSDYQIILIDNASEEQEFDRIDEELQKHPHLLIRNTTNTGFVKATNRGICASKAPFIVLMNNDTEAAPQWIEKLMKPFEEERVGASGPLTTTRDSWQCRQKVKPGYLVLNESSMLAFFCTMFRREVFDKVGLLDEDFGVGFGDDDDFSDRMHRAGYRLALVTELVIPHHHRSTFKKLYEKAEIHRMQVAAIDLFYEKRLKRGGPPKPHPDYFMCRCPECRTPTRPKLRRLTGKGDEWICWKCDEKERLVDGC